MENKTPLTNSEFILFKTAEGAHTIVAKISAMSCSVVSGLMKQNLATVSKPSGLCHFVGATKANPFR